MPVRNATTAYGENFPHPIAALPKTGAKPKKRAEMSAALIPVFRPFCVLSTTCSSSNINDWRMATPVVVRAGVHVFRAVPNFIKGANFFQKFVVQEITLLHQRLDLTLQTALFIHGQLLGGGNDHRDVGRLRFAPQIIENCEAIHFRHHQVENDQVGELPLMTSSMASRPLVASKISKSPWDWRMRRMRRRASGVSSTTTTRGKRFGVTLLRAESRPSCGVGACSVS